MLYQKYRPKTLDEVFGHEKVITELKKRSETNGRGNHKIPQVTILEGTTGVGKNTIAYNLAKILNCSKPINSYTPCNVCDYCKDINEEKFVISARVLNGSMLDTDKMRELEDQSNTMSLTSTSRVVIIDELQELSNNKKALKVLLGILEKQQPDTYYILLTMDFNKLDELTKESIKNRSVHFKLKPQSFDKIADYLATICEKEGIKVDEEKANVLCLIGENCNGSLRTAVSYLERMIELSLWTEKELAEILDVTLSSDLYEIVNEMCFQKQMYFNFKTSFNDEFVGRLRYFVSLILKSRYSDNLNGWEKKQIGSLGTVKLGENHFTIKIKRLMEELNKLMLYPYRDSMLIESTLYLLYSEFKNIKEEEIPRRRIQN